MAELTWYPGLAWRNLSLSGVARVEFNFGAHSQSTWQQYLALDNGRWSCVENMTMSRKWASFGLKTLCSGEDQAIKYLFSFRGNMAYRDGAVRYFIRIEIWPRGISASSITLAFDSECFVYFFNIRCSNLLFKTSSSWSATVSNGLKWKIVSSVMVQSLKHGSKLSNKPYTCIVGIHIVWNNKCVDFSFSNNASAIYFTKLLPVIFENDFSHLHGIDT